MKTTLPLLLFIFLSISAFGQAKFEKGYYITFQGDSLGTYIKNEDWARNPEFIEIKGSPESSVSEKLTLNEIRRFALTGGDLYETFAVDVDMSPVDLNNLVLDASPVITRDTVMLRSLVRGPVNLYVYIDKSSKTHFYISKGQEEPRELLYQKLKRSADGKVSFITLPIYKGMLGTYLTECEQLHAKINKTEFKQSSLSGLILSYNTCVDPSYAVPTLEKETGTVKFGLVAGPLAVTYKFKSQEFYKELVNTDFNGSGYTAGLAINYVLPRAHGRWSIKNEVMFKQYMASGNYSTSTNTYDTKFHLSYLGVNSLLCYSLTTGAVRPFINAGIANNLVVSDKSHQKWVRNYYGTVRETEGKPLDDIRNFEQALLIGAGVTKGKYTAEVRAERGNGFSFYSGLASIKTAFSLQFTYFLR